MSPPLYKENIMGMFDSIGKILKNAPQIALSAVPGIGQFMGAEATNTANAQQAQQQMDFQREMSNTAHQREVTDLKAAGLNPMLSAMGGSGASTPSGAQATMENPLSGMGSLGSSALDIMSKKKDLELKDKQEKQMDLLADKTEEEGRLAAWERRDAEYKVLAKSGSGAAPEFYKQQAQTEKEMAKANFSTAKTTQLNEATNQKYNNLDNTLKRTGQVADQIGKIISPGVKLDTHFKNSAKPKNAKMVDMNTGEILP